MDSVVFKPKIDWWVYALLVFMVVACVAGPVYDGDYIAGVVLGCVMAALWVFAVAGMKYVIKGNKLGIRCLYRWSWLPVDKISEVKCTRGIIASAAMSLDRVSIKFADRSVLKSAMPVEISPADVEGFIAKLREINPQIKVL